MAKYPLVYLFLCGKMRKKSRCRVVPFYIVKETLRRNLINWSKDIQYEVLKDMEKYNLLKKTNASTNSPYEIFPDAEKEALYVLRNANSIFSFCGVFL